MYRVGKKKNLIRVLILIIMLLAAAFALAGSTFAATNGTVNSAIGVNVRSGPGTGYGIRFALADGQSVSIIEKGEGWYKVNCSAGTGWVCADYIKIEADKEYVYNEEFEKSLTAQGFPESYKKSLRKLHAAHPEWVFKSQKTGLYWSDVIAKESRVGVNTVHSSAKNSWKSMDYGAYNYNSGSYVVFDSGGWVAASKSIIQYYMDPRNFLDESGIFQFMAHSYDSATQTKSGLKKLVSGTFLSKNFPENSYATYVDALMDAGKKSGANPYVLASMILMEQGKNGTGKSISGTVKGYEGYYNFFNIRAYASGIYDAVEYGLIYAKGSGSYSRPWNSRAKSILGGSLYYANNFIKNNQNTLYLKKFNVMNGLSGVATNQYMTNVGGAAGEAANLKNGYGGSSAVTFYIPIYKNMPDKVCAMPQSSGNNNYFLKSLSVGGYSLTPVFNMYEDEYEIVVPADTSYVNISASTKDSGASVRGAGRVQLTGSVTKAKITVTSAGGASKNYVITIAKKGGSAQISTKPTSSAYHIGSYYISGVDLKTTVSKFKSNLKAPSGCTLKITDRNGKEKTSGNIGTGCQVTIRNSNGKTLSSMGVVVKGDNSGDGSCNSLDLLLIQKHIVGLSSLSGSNFSGSDINGDGKVNSLDLLFVQRYIVGSYNIKN